MELLRTPRPCRGGVSLRRGSRRAGFTLIEITAAMVIYFLIVTLAVWSMSDADDQSLDAERARQLRMLADLKLGEIAIFERHFDEPLGPEGFHDLPEDLREEFADWEWQTEVGDRTIFGPVKDEHAPSLYESEASTDASQTPTETSSSAAKGKGESQLLREIVLKVTAPADDGEGDAIEIVTYLPQVPAKASGGAAGAGGK